MPKRATSFEVLLSVEDCNGSKQEAFFHALRDAILTGALRPDQKLPSTRDLARSYSVSRGTVVLVYESLESEGYVVSRRGAGTFVAKSLPEQRLVTPLRTADSPVVQGFVTHDRPSHSERQPLSRACHSVLAMPFPKHSATPDTGAFMPFRPAVDRNLVSLWARLTAKHMRTLKPDMLGETHSSGLPQLRCAIAGYLGSMRGIRCAPEQVFLTSDRQDSLLLSAKILTNPGDVALFEDPGDYAALSALRMAELSIATVPVDRFGMQISSFARQERKPKLAFVRPSHQCPTGVAMSPDRRHELLDWALDCGSWIFEDDYGCEFRYEGPPSPSLFSQSRIENVLYSGGFSATIFPALRVSFLVVPPRLVDVFASIQRRYSGPPSVLSQLVLADFIENGHFARHLRRMGEWYRERRLALIESLGRAFSSRVRRVGDACGLEQTIEWVSVGNADQIADAARRHGIHIVPTSQFRISRPVPPGAILGFAAYDSATIHRTMQVLAKIVNSEREDINRTHLHSGPAWSEFRAP